MKRCCSWQEQVAQERCAVPFGD
jgi:hypothetical protein